MTGDLCKTIGFKMADSSLIGRLNALQQQYKQVLALIQRLRQLPTVPGTYSISQTSEDPRAELASEIHQSLKDQEVEFDLLRQEVEDEYQTLNRWVGGGSVRRRNESAEADHERVLAQISRLGEDLKTARASFRRAQLEAKKNADQARRKERELLFAGARATDDGGSAEQPLGRRRGQEKLTEDELALDASNDVTASLKRTHDLMQAQLEQSTFAQQTLDESSAALEGLDESYSSLNTMLASGRSLVKALLASQKSDTWYLETAWKILLVTIAWLIFRRILYGPLWWLVWQPVKWAWWLLATTVSMAGAFGRAQPSLSAVSGTTTSLYVPPQATDGPPRRQDFQPEGPFLVVGGGGKGGGWGQSNVPPQQNSAGHSRQEDDQSMVNKIGEMADKGAEAHPDGKGTNVDDISEEEKARQEELPRNPKKRMWEHEKQGRESSKDEL